MRQRSSYAGIFDESTRAVDKTFGEMRPYLMTKLRRGNRRLSRLAALPLGFLLLLTAAQAAYADAYDLLYGPSPGGGYGHTTGTLNWVDTNTFQYFTNIEDLCPADGYGVSFYFEMTMVSGNQQLSTIKGWDTNGCGNGFEYWPGPVNKDHAIKRTRLISCWTNDGNLCWAVPPNGISTWKDNQYT